MNFIPCLADNVENAAFTDRGQLKSKEGAFCDAHIYFSDHKTQFENETLSETMEMIITTDPHRRVFSKTIRFDHEHFRNLCRYEEFETVPELLALSEEILGDLLRSRDTTTRSD